MNAMPETLNEIMDKDLAGFQLTTVYSLQLKHGLMGYFPALITETDEIVVCLDRGLLAKVMEKLTRRRSKVDEDLVLANISGQYCFEIDKDRRVDIKPLHILTEEEFDRRTRREKEPFKWAPGLVGQDMTEAEFREALALAAQENP